MFGSVKKNTYLCTIKLKKFTKMEKLTSKEYNKILKEIGVSYLGSFSQSAKLALNERVGNVLTYSIYLAPWKLASSNDLTINTCPSGVHCHELCLNGAGHNKGDILFRGAKESHINKARIKKTRFFYKDRERFMQVLCYELEKTKEYAERNGFGFSVRLNCTSDLSPLAFKLGGKNILELYPNVTFYDYTKVVNRLDIPKTYPNYNLTFSFDGYNWNDCEKYLEIGGNVAVVFESDELPISFRGYRVIDMTKTDLRYLDAKSNDGNGFVGYLHFHRPASLYKGGKYERPNTPFVIREDNPEVLYAFKHPKDIEE